MNCVWRLGIYYFELTKMVTVLKVTNVENFFSLKNFTKGLMLLGFYRSKQMVSLQREIFCLVDQGCPE